MGPIQHLLVQVVIRFMWGCVVLGSSAQDHRELLILKLVLSCLQRPMAQGFCELCHCLGPHYQEQCQLCLLCALAPFPKIRGSDGRRAFFCVELRMWKGNRQRPYIEQLGAACPGAASTQQSLSKLPKVSLVCPVFVLL